MPSIRWSTAILALALAAGPGYAPAHPNPNTHPTAWLDVWKQNHPQAAQALGAWVREHRDAARQLFSWGGRDTFDALELLKWAVANPGQGLAAFVPLHPDWKDLNELNHSQGTAMDAFLAWCRHFPAAADTLVHHEWGLRWAGQHIDSKFWDS
jgi:hypothetical protein